MTYETNAAAQESAVSAAEAVAAVTETKVRVKKTLPEKIEALEKRIADDSEKLAELIAERDNADRLSGVVAGTHVTIKLGRKFKDKDTTRVVPGVVVAVKEDDDGDKLLKVQIGDGFDAEYVVVGPGAIQTAQIPSDPLKLGVS